MNNWESLAVLVLIMAFVWIFDRKNFKKEGIMFLRRTERGLETIDSFAKKHARVLRSIADFAVVFSFGYLGLKYIQNERRRAKDSKSIWPLFAAYTLAMGAVTVVFDPIFSSILSFFSAPESMVAVVVPVLKILTLAFGVSGYAFFSMLLGAFAVGINALGGNMVKSPVNLVLPVEVPESYGLPVYSVPIIPWFLSILIILAVHEFSHAAISRVEGIKVKSMGYGFMLVMPLGFAEPDEKQIQKSESIKKARIFAAGSFANFVTGCFFIILLLGMAFASGPLMDETHTDSGLGYAKTQEGFPAHTYLPKEGVIESVNGIPVYNLTEFVAQIDKISPGKNITLVIDNRTYSFPTAKDPKNESRAYLGISEFYISKKIKDEVIGTQKEFIVNSVLYLRALFGWIILLNIGIGIANLMPLKPFDGGLMAEEIIKGARVPKPKRIADLIGRAMLVILLFALFAPLAIKAMLAILGLF